MFGYKKVKDENLSENFNYLKEFVTDLENVK